jgi:LuxR family maltose regulon positive regulatory protein
LIALLALSALSLVYTELGRLAEAEGLAQAAAVIADRGELGQAPQSSLAYTAVGAVLAARGELAAAKRELERALALRRAVWGISPWPTLPVLLLLARAELRLGDDGAAKQLAEEAGELLAGMPEGTGALHAQLAGLDRRLAGPARWTPGAEPLTERESAVLRLLAGTLSLREIGQEMFVSTNTVKTHVQRIYRKLGVTTRQEAVRRGRHDGII